VQLLQNPPLYGSTEIDTTVIYRKAYLAYKTM
jgi:hypothetical protein